MILVLKEDILKFQISVNNAALVAGSDCMTDLQNQTSHLNFIKMIAFANVMVELAAGTILHDEYNLFSDQKGMKKLDDAFMAKHL